MMHLLCCVLHAPGWGVQLLSSRRRCLLPHSFSLPGPALAPLTLASTQYLQYHPGKKYLPCTLHTALGDCPLNLCFTCPSCTSPTYSLLHPAHFIFAPPRPSGAYPRPNCWQLIPGKHFLCLPQWTECPCRCWWSLPAQQSSNNNRSVMRAPRAHLSSLPTNAWPAPDNLMGHPSAVPNASPLPFLPLCVTAVSRRFPATPGLSVLPFHIGPCFSWILPCTPPELLLPDTCVPQRCAVTAERIWCPANRSTFALQVESAM